MFCSQKEAALSVTPVLHPTGLELAFQDGKRRAAQQAKQRCAAKRDPFDALRKLYRSDQTVRARMNRDMQAILAGKTLRVDPETLNLGIRRRAYASAIRAMVETHLERRDGAHLGACVSALALGLPLPDTRGPRLASREVYDQIARRRVRDRFGLDLVTHLHHGRVVPAEEFQGVAKRYGAEMAHFRFRTHVTYQSGITPSQAKCLDEHFRNLYGSLVLEGVASNEEVVDTSRDRPDGGHSDPAAVKAARASGWGYLYDDDAPFEYVRMWSHDETASVADALPPQKDGLRKLGLREGALALTHLALMLTGARWAHLSRTALRRLSRRLVRASLPQLRDRQAREQTERQRGRERFVSEARRDGSLYLRTRKKVASRLLGVVTSFQSRGQHFQRYLAGQLTCLLILRYAEQVVRRRWKHRHQPRSLARGTALLLRNRRVDEAKEGPTYGPELPYAARALKDFFAQQGVTAGPVRLSTGYGLAVSPGDGGLVIALDVSDIRAGRKHLGCAGSFCLFERETSLAYFLLPEDFDALSARENAPDGATLLEYGARVTQIDRPVHRFPVTGKMRDTLERLTRKEPINRADYRVIDLSKHKELSDYRSRRADPPFMAANPVEAGRAERIRHHLYRRFELAGYNAKHSNSVNIEAVYSVIDEVALELGGVLSLKDLGDLIGEVGYLNGKGQFRFRISPLVRQFAATARPEKLRLQEQEVLEHACSDVPQSDLELAKEALDGVPPSDPRYEELLADYTFLQERRARFLQMVERANERKRRLDQAFSDHLTACTARVEKVTQGNAPRGAVAALAQARLLAAGL